MTVWNRRSFLVDCGADESVLPASAADRQHRLPSTPLIASNSTLIKTWGKLDSSILLSKGHAFTQEFHIANTTDPILGADFFASNRLAIDMASKRLISLDDLNVVATGAASISSICGLHVARIRSFDAIVDDFPELVSSPRTPTSTAWSITSLRMAHLFTLVLAISSRCCQSRVC